MRAKKTGALSPTPRSICLKAVWDNGAIALGGCGDGDLALIDGLVSDEMLSYCGKLFTPDEAAYLDYMFNDASFPNSQVSGTDTTMRIHRSPTLMRRTFDPITIAC